MNRRLNFQTLSWFHDLHSRDLLDMDPPYQRRSVWNQSFKDYFVDTVLLNYPAPAIFLYEEITPTGRSMYHVVDGKQRLTTLFEFTSSVFPVGDKSELQQLRGIYFDKLSDTIKREVWSYQFLLEYVPAEDPNVITAIFDRINRNVAKLSAQELRHARLDGLFITTSEQLTAWISDALPRGFPRFAEQSRKQMKDTEFTALLLLLLELGPRGFSQDNLDEEFTKRDTEWDLRGGLEDRFRATVTAIQKILESVPDPRLITGTRFRNQADFYSLFGAVDRLLQQEALPPPTQIAERLLIFIESVEGEATRQASQAYVAYYDAARSASNDTGPRTTRIEILQLVISGRLQ
ncbi:MAG: DUF262 domain-containing protein [Proteobacteria bacterium]|nr:DUF262 domain-containing protein [Pseudomonadota bacterium]